MKKRKNKKIFKIRSKKLNIYYNIQKSIPLKRKKVRLNVIKKYTETGLYVRDYFLSKIFRLFRVYKNMIFLFKKKALSSKMKSVIFKNYNYFLVMIKFVKTLNTDIKFYFNKCMLLNRNFKINSFIEKKSKTKYSNKRSSTKVFRKKKIVNVAKKKRKKFRKYEYLFKTAAVKELVSSYFNFSYYSKSMFSRKLSTIYNLKYFLTKLFSKFTKAGNKGFSKRILFSFFTFLKKKYFISMNIYGWLKAYMIQIFLKLVPIFGYMFIKYRRDFLKVPKVFRYSHRSFNNGVSISIG